MSIDKPGTSSHQNLEFQAPSSSESAENSSPEPTPDERSQRGITFLGLNVSIRNPFKKRLRSESPTLDTSKQWKKPRQHSGSETPGMKMKRKVIELAEKKINFDDFKAWYNTEMSRVKAELDLNSALKKLTESIAPLALPATSTETSSEKFINTVVRLLDKIVTLQTHLGLQTNEPLQPNPDGQLTPSTLLGQKLTLSPSLDHSSLCPDVNHKEHNPFRRLQDNPEQIMALYKSTDQQNELIKSSTELIKICLARIKAGGREIPQKELSSDLKNEYFYSIFPTNPGDIKLLRKLSKVEPQSSRVINHLKVLVCEAYIIKSFEANTFANTHALMSNSRKEEARQARLQWLTTSEKPNLGMVNTILGRPQGLRADLDWIVKNRLDPEGKNMSDHPNKAIKKMRQGITKVLGDESKKRDMITVNELVLDVQQQILKLIIPIDNELKSWPDKYADFMNPRQILANN